MGAEEELVRAYRLVKERRLGRYPGSAECGIGGIAYLQSRWTGAAQCVRCLAITYLEPEDEP